MNKNYLYNKITGDMKNIFIKNIKGLVQVGETLPNRIGGIDASKVPVIENAFLALEDGCKVVAYGSMEDWGRYRRLEKP
jgi:hypothetical protein